MTSLPSTSTAAAIAEVAAATLGPSPELIKHLRQGLPVRPIPIIPDEMCPGFCGRIKEPSGNLSNCMACPWGSRVEGGYMCTDCDTPIEAYAWLYLLLVALAPCLFNSLHVRRSVEMFKKHSTWAELAEHVSIVVECALAAIGTLLVFEPYGSLRLNGCRATRMKQWYTWMFNPTVRHARILPCAHEVVYPLQSLPLVYLSFCLVNTLVIRSILYLVWVRKHRPARSYYASLFTLPLLGVANVLASGVIYHVFPYVIIMYSLGGQAVQFAYLKPLSRADLYQKMVKTPRELAHALTLMGLFGFSIVAIMVRNGPDDWSVICTFLGLVAVPPIFFTFSTVLTHPVGVVGVL